MGLGSRAGEKESNGIEEGNDGGKDSGAVGVGEQGPDEQKERCRQCVYEFACIPGIQFSEFGGVGDGFDECRGGQDGEERGGKVAKDERGGVGVAGSGEEDAEGQRG